MKIDFEDVTLIVPEEKLPQHTLRFLTIILGLIYKAKGNPAHELQALSIMVTGKTFSELTVKSEIVFEDALVLVSMLSDFVKASMLKQATDSRIKSSEGIVPDMSGTTIEDILKNKDNGTDDGSATNE